MASTDDPHRRRYSSSSFFQTAAAAAAAASSKTAAAAVAAAVASHADGNANANTDSNGKGKGSANDDGGESESGSGSGPGSSSITCGPAELNTHRRDSGGTGVARWSGNGFGGFVPSERGGAETGSSNVEDGKGGGGAETGVMGAEVEDAAVLRAAAVGAKWRRKHAQLLQAVG